MLHVERAVVLDSGHHPSRTLIKITYSLANTHTVGEGLQEMLKFPDPSSSSPGFTFPSDHTHILCPPADVAMPLLNHTLSRYFSNVVHHGHLEPSIFYHTSSLDAWPSELVDKPDRFVDKVEACFAHTMTPGLDGCPPIVDKEHHHTFLRIILVPSEDHPEETIFVERVLSQQDGATHSVIPVAMDAATASSGVRNTFHDHACIILEGSPSALIHAHHLKADRTTHVSDCRERRLSLFELATLLRFVSAHGLRAVSLGMDTECETYSRWFCRASMSALSVVMRGASRQLTPPKVGVATCIEQATQKSVDAWLNSTFKAYPAREVGAENLTRQWNVMNEEEREKRLQQVVKRVEDEERKVRVQEAFRRLMLAQSKTSI